MIPIDITGKWTGVSEVKAKFADIRRKVPQVFEAETLAPWLIERIRARFLKQQSPEGTPWKGRSAKTKEGGQLLYRTKALYKAIGVVESGLGATSTGFGFRIGVRSRPYIEFSKHSARVVDPAVYGRAHQQGIRVPKRRFIGVSSEDVTLVANRARRKLQTIVE